MRTARFIPWFTGLVDAALPAEITRVDWQSTGIGDDAGEGHHTFGLVLRTPAGGMAYMRFVHGAPDGGDPMDKPERIVTKPPMDPVPSVPLALRNGKLHLIDIEQWLKAVLINSGSEEMASVEAFTERPEAERKTHPYGIGVHWHNGGEAWGFFNYTLSPGEHRAKDKQYQLREAV